MNTCLYKYFISRFYSRLYFILAATLLFVSEMQLVNAAKGNELKAGFVNPGHHDKPDWFKVSFLDLDEDIAEAAEENKRIMLFFYQDGCPYCEKLLEVNFKHKDIVEQTKKQFDVIVINIWGDREVTIKGKIMTEKQFASALKVQYTPTLVMFNEQGKVAYRANGYYPPEKFLSVLDYVGNKKDKTMSWQAYLEKHSSKKTKGKMRTDVISVENIGNLKQSLTKGRHMMVLFEQKQCDACDELHDDVFERVETEKQLKRLDVALYNIWSNDAVVTPKGEKLKVSDWVKKLNILYTPTMVYFNDQGEEVFRTDAYLKSFHIQSVMDYVASSAYKKETNFQRYIDRRAEHLREQGQTINLME